MVALLDLPKAQKGRLAESVELFDVYEGEQVGEAQIDRRTEIFDLTRFTVQDGKREIPSILWTQRTRKESR